MRHPQVEHFRRVFVFAGLEGKEVVDGKNHPALPPLLEELRLLLDSPLFDEIAKHLILDCLAIHLGCYF